MMKLLILGKCHNYMDQGQRDNGKGSLKALCLSPSNQVYQVHSLTSDSWIMGGRPFYHSRQSDNYWGVACRCHKNEPLESYPQPASVEDQLMQQLKQKLLILLDWFPIRDPTLIGVEREHTLNIYGKVSSLQRWGGHEVGEVKLPVGSYPSSWDFMSSVIEDERTWNVLEIWLVCVLFQRRGSQRPS